MRPPTRVLIIEDNRAACVLFRNFLEGRGMEVCGVAHNGAEGLRLARESGPDLILLDLVMPDVDGIRFLELLNEEDLPQKPKVVVLSGVESDEFVQLVIRLGCSYYLMKPVYLEELAARLNQLFSTREEVHGRYGPLLARLGADGRCLGFRFACRGAELLREAEGSVQLKEIYLRLAAEHHTTWSCVERNLRTTVRQIHAAAGTLYRERLGLEPKGPRPDNGTFLRALAKL